jgi:hypothetical protein
MNLGEYYFQRKKPDTEEWYKLSRINPPTRQKADLQLPRARGQGLGMKQRMREFQDGG